MVNENPRYLTADGFLPGDFQMTMKKNLSDNFFLVRC